MSNIVFIESNFSGAGFEMLRLAHELGLRTMFLSRDPGRYLRAPGAQLLERCVDTTLRCETNDPEQVTSSIAAQKVRPRAVVSTGEYHLGVAAQVAQRLGLPGMDPQAAAAARNKGRTRTICRDAGVPVPAFVAVEGADEAAAAARQVGLPCVVKPVDGHSSEGVRLCYAEDDVAAAVAALRRRDPLNPAGQRREDTVLIEQYLVGPEVSVETITQNGATTVVAVTDKLLAGRPYFVELGHLLPSGLPARLVERCAQVARQALEALGIDLGVCHTELKISDGKPYLIEVNARPGGDRITDLVELATGVPLLLDDLLLRLDRTVRVAPNRRRGAAIHFLTAPAGGVRGVTGTEFASNLPGIEEVALTVSPGADVGPLVDSGGRCGHVIATADTGYLAGLLARTAAQEITIDVAPVAQPAAETAGGTC